MKKGCWKLIDLYPGAHIRIKVNSFYHHAIYIGNGEVVQFGLPFDISNNNKDVKVLRSPLSDFCKPDDFIEVYCYSKKELKQKFKDEEIINNALSHVGEGGYNILKNNCEHFANLCCLGIAKSEQIDSAYQDVDKILKSEGK